MTGIAAGVIFVTLGSIGVLAQNSQQYRSCLEKALAQKELNACAGEEVKRVDAELNDVYKALLAAAAGQPNAVAKITAAERAWIAYRGAYMEAMYPAPNKISEYGSIYPMAADLLRAELTTQHIKALRDLLKQYGGSNQ
jgi:uncharacterized protein YecT (DUF1311 family)